MVEKKILVDHGGIVDGDWDLNYLLERPLATAAVAQDEVVFNILWSMPKQLSSPFHDDTPKRDSSLAGCSRAGATYSDGVGMSIAKACYREVTEAFCQRNGIGLIIRSH